jgi:predicted ATPase
MHFIDESAVLDLLCESLQDDREHLQKLAKVIHTKTMGNTLFVIQFLAILYRRSLVYFDWY